jgi:hypothetical protein
MGKITYPLIIIALIIGATACTQKSFEIAPGRAEPTNTPPNQPQQMPNNPHPVVVDQFYFKKQNQGSDQTTQSDNSVQPPPES